MGRKKEIFPKYSPKLIIFIIITIILKVCWKDKSRWCWYVDLAELANKKINKVEYQPSKALIVLGWHALEIVLPPG